LKKCRTEAFESEEAYSCVLPITILEKSARFVFFSRCNSRQVKDLMILQWLLSVYSSRPQ
jgi:hypothetical protein